MLRIALLLDPMPRGASTFLTDQSVIYIPERGREKGVAGRTGMKK
jgi:hypothetical protein